MENEELLPKPQVDLPKPLTDLPLPEKEIPARATSQGQALQNQKPNIFKSKFFLGFVAFSILIAFLIGGFMLAKNNSSKQIACTVEAKICPDGSSVGRSGPKCEFTPCPTASPNSTADWKTYTNSDFGYSFKHPSNLKIEELEDQYNLITTNKTKSIKISPDSGEYLLNIFVEKNPKNLSAVDLLMKYKSTIEKPTNPNDPSGKFVIDKINSSLSEYKNGEIEGLHALFGFDYDYDIVIATKNNNIYVFDYYGDQGGKITENNEKIVNQILSTFKFTESNSDNNKITLLDYQNNKFYMDAPADSSVNGNNVTISGSTFNVISTGGGDGPCNPDDYGTTCGYEDEKMTNLPSGLKIGVLRVWGKNGTVFMLNPQSIYLNDKYLTETLLITKTSPNTTFTPAEVSVWKNLITTIDKN